MAFALLVLLLAAAGVYAIRCRIELGRLRQDNQRLAARNLELEAREAERARLADALRAGKSDADRGLRDALAMQGSGIERLEAKVRALEKWGRRHRELEEQAITALDGEHSD